MDSKEAYYHAWNIGRFPEGEAVIAKDTFTAFRYAFYIIKERFPEGEAAIAKSTTSAYIYAKEVIKERFPEGEAAIMEDSLLWRAYKKRFCIAESVDWTKEGF